MMANNSKDLTFRYDINALRAIAVIGVILFHFKISFLSGGFAGVDVFFVISGYLMSRIIFSSLDRNSFSFKEYFEKRLQRIVPALLFLILLVSVICFFLYMPTDYKLSQKNAAGSVLFLSNILYWTNSNYFDPASENNLFLHTWSLSVEWQFYLFYPLLVLLLYKTFKNRSSILYLYILSVLAIFLTTLIMTNRAPAASFYLLPTRCWEMMIGGIAFLVENKIKNIRHRFSIAIIGYGSILASFCLLDTTVAWPGLYTLLPIAGTFLVIIGNYNEWKTLQNKLIQFIGRISYSLYLWHWPLYVLSQYLGIDSNSKSALFLTLASFLFGYISFKYIESLKISSSKILFTIMFFFLGTALLSHLDSNHVLLKPETIEISNFESTHKKEIAEQFSSGKCFIAHYGKEEFDKINCLVIQKEKKNFLLIGDSHAAQLSQSLREALLKENINLLQVTASGGLPSVRANGKDRFINIMKYVFHDFITNNYKEIDGVIISAHWALYKKRLGDITPEEYFSYIKETILYLNNYDINTIIIGQNEEYKVPFSTIAAREFELNVKISDQYLSEDTYEVDSILAANFKPYYINIINKKKIPPLSPNNIPYMFDQNHFTKYGADLTVQKILSNPTARAFFLH